MVPRRTATVGGLFVMTAWGVALTGSTDEMFLENVPPGAAVLAGTPTALGWLGVIGSTADWQALTRLANRMPATAIRLLQRFTINLNLKQER